MADELHGVKRKMLDFNRQCNKLKDEKATLIKRLAGGTNGSVGRITGTGGGSGGNAPTSVEDIDMADAVISGVLSWRDPEISIVSTRPSTAIISSARPKFVGGGFNLSQPAT